MRFWPQLALFGACVLLMGAAQSQTAPSTIHVTSRLVDVDVVVRDSRGAFVRGLKASDFKLTEDNAAQSIDYFSEHTYELAGSQKPRADRASRWQFTNVPPEGTVSGSVTMVLLDLLNTPQTDQVYARGQMLKFLQSLPPGQQVALFILTDRLHMLQGFTGDSETLVRVAKKLDTKAAYLVRSETQRMQDDDVLAKLEAAIGRSPSAESGNSISSRWRSENWLYEAVNADTRARDTMMAFAELANATAGYPGRKNLLWLSASFPLAVGAYMQLNNPAIDMMQNINAMPGARETENLIASLQIAVYPISVLGVQTSFVGPESNGDGAVTLMGPNGLDSTMNGQFTNRSILRNSMENIAAETGGEAFFGTNDLARALRRGLEDGSNYYTVAYRPKNQKWDGKFRSIHVRVAGKRYSLTYRRGYFAFADKPAPFDPKVELDAALQPSNPELTMLRLRARVSLPDAKQETVRVESSIDGRTIQFSTDEKGVHHAKLLVLLIALNDGAPQPAAPPQAMGLLNLDLDEKAYAQALDTGVPVRQELQLPEGKYRLRLGVCDTENRRLGSLDIPLTIIK